MSKLHRLPTDPYARPRPTPDVAFTVVISSGVTSSGLTLTPTEFEQVLAGGTAVSNTIDAGGQVTVMSGGLTEGDVIESGGVEVLSAGASASGIIISSGGLISGPGVIDGATIYGFAAGLSLGPVSDYLPFGYVASGGTASALSVLADAALDVESSGVAEATAVSSGGYLSVDQGGLASGSILRGGAMVVYGEADATTVTYSGYAYVAGLVSSSTSDTTSGVVPGLMSGATIAKGAELVVASAGLASSVVAESGGILEVESGGVIAGATLYASTLTVELGGVASGLTLSSGASATIQPGGEAIGVKVVSGTVSLVGRAEILGLTLSAGGALVDNFLVIDGGAAGQTGTTVLAGKITGSGLLAELSGGTLELSGTTSAFTGEVIVGGGKVELANAGAVARAKLDFDNLDMAVNSMNGVFQIDAADQPVNGGGFAAPLVDFSLASQDQVDLAGLAFTSGATAKVSGTTLTLVDGGYTATFTLSHTRAARYGVKSDGKGGTLIEAGGSAVALVEAAAGFQPTAGGMVLSAAEMRSAGLDTALGGTGPATLRHGG